MADNNQELAESGEMLDEFKQGMADMQSSLEQAYSDMDSKEINGFSNDKTVEIIMTATYKFVDINFDERALKGGVKEFKWRIREAFKSLTENIQNTTQEQVMDMFKDVQIPDGLKELVDQAADEEGN